MEIMDDILKKLTIKNYYFSVNSLGCADCKEKYSRQIKEYFSHFRENLCSDCQARLQQAPLRILDCKKRQCRQVIENCPEIQQVLCKECKSHFNSVEQYLIDSGINYKINHKLVRGLDYYTRTVFEVFSEEDQNAIAAGGRYDNLIGQLGGPDIPAVGFAIGMERILPYINIRQEEISAVYGIFLDETAKAEGRKILAQLRKEGIKAEAGYQELSLRAHMKTADKTGKEWCIIIGKQEIEKNEVLLKRMSSGQQEKINRNQIVNIIKERLK
jgi:histidyl-tRNA synthetase